MNDAIKLQNARNFLRSELHNELIPKIDKRIDYGKVVLLQKILNILI